MLIISSLTNSLKNSSIVRLISGPAKRSSRRRLASLDKLARSRALKPGLNRTTALCLICACNSRSQHSSAVRFNRSLAYGTGSVQSKASSISLASSSKLAMSKTLRGLSPDHQLKQRKHLIKDSIDVLS
jgi:hypothetical protein